MPIADSESAKDLGSFIDRSPSPYHAVAESAILLLEAGFLECHEVDDWKETPAEKAFFRRGGSLVAWTRAAESKVPNGFRIVAAHTDSPNLRIKPQPDSTAAGVRQLGIEIYGGALLNSWLDRDLGLSGRVSIGGDPLSSRLILINEPLLRVPQLAIHLDRDVNRKGLILNQQTHMAPIWADGSSNYYLFAEWIAEQAGISSTELCGWDLMTHDLTPSALLGADRAFLAAPRIDNLASCYAGVSALAGSPTRERTQVLSLFDHEEVGSVSNSGAAGSLLLTALERIHALEGGGRSDFLRALADSTCISADGAHATHPNYVDRHEPEHQISLNGGPVIKRNANVRYATDADSQAFAENACRKAGVPFQLFVNRTDLTCGSTIGPVTAAQLGIPTADIGLPQLSMHSAREMCGAADPYRLAAALEAFYGS